MNTIRQAAMAVVEAGGRVEYALALDNLRREITRVEAEITEAIRERDQNAQKYMDDMQEKDTELAALRAKVAEMEGRKVPTEFLQGFNTLAHNYSLRAIPPDYYSGTEGDAFSAAYKRCGEDLADLRKLLEAAPRLSHEQS